MSSRSQFRRAAKTKKPRTLTLQQLEDWLGEQDPPAPCVSMIDGYLAALIVSPEFLPPESWLRPIVGADLVWAPDTSPEGVVRNTLFQRYNQISSTLSGGPKRYAPIFMRTDDEQVLLEQYANGFWFGMQLTLDTWKPFLADRELSAAVMLILAHCTTMIDEDVRLALISPQGAQALAESWKIVPDIVEMLHRTLAASRNIEIR
jgi:uncharacterized protein